MNYFRLFKDLVVAQKHMKWPCDRLKKYQNKELRKLLYYAWENSTYYRNLYETAGISKEDLEVIPLSALPSICKNELLQNFDEIITINRVTQKQLRSFDEKNSNFIFFWNTDEHFDIIEEKNL